MARVIGVCVALLLCVALGVGVFAQSSGGSSFQGTITTLRSSNGALVATLVDHLDVVNIGGVPTISRVWNDSYIGPTLRLQPGDLLSLTLVNNLNVTTNIHFHGLQVSPIAPSDNSLLTLQPQTVLQYQVRIPSSHPPGLYWYHSHAHGNAESQVIGGMVGAIIIEGILAPFPQLSGIAEDLFVLNNYIADPASVPISGMRLVNGVSQSTLTVNAGETRFWRFCNLAADLYYNLTFPSELSVSTIAIDGQLQNQATRVSTYLLGPSSRVELLVTTPTTATTLQLSTAHVDTGPTGDDYPGGLLTTVVVSSSGTSVLNVDPNTLVFPTLLDYRTVPTIRTRTLNFNDDMVQGVFLINNKVFDPNRVDITVTLGDIEQWIIENSSSEVHVRCACRPISKLKRRQLY